MIILCDVDGVLADFAGAVVEVVNGLFGRSHTIEDVHSYGIAESLGLTDEQWSEVCTIIDQPGFARSLRALESVDQLRKKVWGFGGPSVEFVTSPWDSPTWCYDRSQWLTDQFGGLGRHVTFTGRKWMMRGDVFVDDNPTAVRDWAHHNPAGRALLWDAPWNRGETRDLDRVSSMAEVFE